MHNNILLGALALCQLLSPASALSRLDVIPTAGGFTTAFKGWTSFPLQAYKRTGFPYGDAWFTEDNIQRQANALVQNGLREAGYNYVMIDSGWSVGANGDDNGRIIPNPTLFPNFQGFISELHQMGLKVGIYVVPGVFKNDYDNHKQIFNTPFTISDVSTNSTSDYFSRVKIDYTEGTTSREAGRAWVKTVVDQFASWGIDLIKIDYLQPHTSGPDDLGNGDNGDHYGEVHAYRDAISQSANPKIWLLESYALDISETSLPTWRATGDSYRITIDVNNSPDDQHGNPSTMVSWFAVQRTVEAMRIYISVQLGISRPLKGYPDLDSMMIGNVDALNMITPDQRRTYFSFWIITGVPIYLGDDLTKLHHTYLDYLTHDEVNAIHREWTSTLSPAFYVNPNDGSRNPAQLQIWAAGPFGAQDEVVVLLANMGCPEIPGIPIGYTECHRGKQNVVATFDKLQIQGSYCNRDVWARQDTGRADTQISRMLGEGESVLFKLTPVANGGNC